MEVCLNAEIIKSIINRLHCKTGLFVNCLAPADLHLRDGQNDCVNLICHPKFLWVAIKT